MCLRTGWQGRPGPLPRKLGSSTYQVSEDHTQQVHEKFIVVQTHQ